MHKTLGRTISLGAALAVSLFAVGARANVYSFDTAVGATAGGQPVDAEITFTTGLNSLTISVQNLEVNPTSVVQNISGLGFSISGLSADTYVPGTSSSSGTARTINGDGTYSDAGSVSTGWAVSLSSSVELNGLGGALDTPAHTIVGKPDGSGNYSNGNGSIDGNGPHNPFLAGDVTFDLTIDGLTAQSVVTSMFFQFGTTAGTDVPGKPTTTPVPDGGLTVSMLGLSLIGIQALRRKLGC